MGQTGGKEEGEKGNLKMVKLNESNESMRIGNWIQWDGKSKDIKTQRKPSLNEQERGRDFH